MEMNGKRILEEFLSVPLTGGDALFEWFSQLPGAITGQGSERNARYVCIPGTREDRVVLVAHADTVWDEAYGYSMETGVFFEDGVFRGTNEGCGIGADDRAGCAMLWAMRNSGHTLLLLDGEERGKIGARYLKRENEKLFRMLNSHQFMIELDWQGTGGCLFNQVDYTNRFHHYITNSLGFRDDKMPGGSDLQVLCHRICGVNIGVGYHANHLPGETLILAEWENTRSLLQAFLQNPQPRFSISILRRVRRYLGAAKGKLVRFLKRSK